MVLWDNIKLIWKNGAKLSVKIRYTFLELKMALQRAIYGYDETMVNNLNKNIVLMLLMVLKDFRSNNYSHPIQYTESEWDDVIVTMIKDLDYMYEYLTWEVGNPVTYEDHKDSFFNLFANHLEDMWR